jgi:hypothetical protein
VTPSEHYTKATELLEVVDEWDVDPAQVDKMLRSAYIHAMLAQTQSPGIPLVVQPSRPSFERPL